MSSIVPSLRSRTDLPGERWRPVRGYEGLYEVSSLSRVWSIPRPGSTGGLLTPHWAGRYMTVKLSRNGKVATPRVHRLVGEAFLGPLPPGKVTRHGPAGASANGVTDLCYGTQADNVTDQIRDGTLARGSAVKSAKLTEQIVAECRVRATAGEFGYALAVEFGVSAEVMNKAIRGTTWRHVTPPGSGSDRRGGPHRSARAGRVKQPAVPAATQTVHQ